MKTIEYEWFIPFNVPSLKNSKIKGKNGIFHSKTVGTYLKKLGIQSYSSSKKLVKGYKTIPNSFADILTNIKSSIDDNWGYMTFAECVSRMTNDFSVPLELGFHFVRDSKREFDFGNACQIIQDLIVAHDCIPDDSMKYLIPIPYQRNEQWYTVDKEKCGVYLKILNKI